ncbi:hypothetical protein GCM10010442_80630 [Kitasatospora kifunensis]
MPGTAGESWPTGPAAPGNEVGGVVVEVAVTVIARAFPRFGDIDAGRW